MRMESEMIALAFFFLLCSGEHAATKSESTPFEFKDVQLWQGRLRLNLIKVTGNEILAASFSSLTFELQKNATRGETIVHSCSGDHDLCPVRYIVRHIIYLRQNNVLQITPLAMSCKDNGSTFKLKPANITEFLKQSVTFLGPKLGFLASDISARSLRDTGANSLLCSGVDPDVVRLLGRCRSDEMLRCLHTSAEPLTRTFVSQMLSGGAFMLMQNQDCPSF